MPDTNNNDRPLLPLSLQDIPLWPMSEHVQSIRAAIRAGTYNDTPERAASAVLAPLQKQINEAGLMHRGIEQRQHDYEPGFVQGQHDYQRSARTR